MGMYTGLRGKVKIKEQFVPLIKQLLKKKTWEGVEGYPFIEKWKKYGRCDFIPYGNISYMPRDWKWLKPTLDKNNYFAFSCSLKNYNDEIAFFIDNVLKNIIESIDYLEERYEENKYSTFYYFNDGRINSMIKKDPYEEDYF